MNLLGIIPSGVPDDTTSVSGMSTKSPIDDEGRLEQADCVDVADSGYPMRNVCVLRGHEGIVTAVAISGNGMTVVSGGDDCTIRVWCVVAMSFWFCRDYGLVGNYSL